MARRFTRDILKTEAASGTVLGLAALTALVLANSPLSDAYFTWLKSEQLFQAGPLSLDLSISDWIKDGLMAVFFLVVGLEIKHEIRQGELSDPRTLATPVLAALGGMLAPAGIYLLATTGLGGPHQGWPIPLATDIAFALALFALVGRGLPSSLRVFLLALAIVDDLGAVVLIALLFSAEVDWGLVGGVAVLLGVGGVLSRRRIAAPFWVLGFALVWWTSLQAGLSPALAAVAFAAIVPVSPRADGRQSPLKAAMHDLHPYVAYLVLPLFAFAKAGVSFAGLSPEQMFAPLVLAIAAGLFLGKQAGVFGAVWLAARFGLGRRPVGATWAQVYGVSLLCGVGFTMSLFIGALAFPGAADSSAQIQVKLGVLMGSALSAVAGLVVLSRASRQRTTPPTAAITESLPTNIDLRSSHSVAFASHRARSQG